MTAISPTTLKALDHRFTAIDGVRLHYVTAGDSRAPTIVLLAGSPESWYAWRHVIPRLAAEYRVIAIDLPGQGDSDKPQDGYDTRSLAQSVHRLLATMGIETYVLAAHDIGAWVALPYALMFSGELSGLALFDAGIPGVTLPDLLPATPDRGWKTWHFAFHTVPDLPEALIAGRERIYLDWFLRRKVANPDSITDTDLDEYVRIFTRPGALRAGLAYYREVHVSAAQNRELVAAGKIGVPVLAVSADQGSIPDMAGPLRAYASDLQGAVVTDSGHFIPEEQPEQTYQLLSDFLTRVRTH
jgi:pimeloyl-ACP methyl ester carboxylesterase